MNAKLFVLLIIGLWLGMVIGISFLEAPLKFKAPNISLVLGLGIGKLVFGALNKFEMVFSVILTLWLIKEYKDLDLFSLIGLGALILMIIVQSVWLIPILNTRADSLIQGFEVAASNHHIYYVVIEVVKVILLFYSFIKIYHYEGHL